MTDSFRILRLKSENFKRIRMIDITPKGNLVRITGANASGKSSTLDSIAAVLGGKACCPAKPIRHGQDEALIWVDIGPYEITRMYTEDDKTSIVVRPKEGPAGLKGKPIRGAQDFLEQFYGDLTFDPLAFSRMKPKDQYEELRRIANLGPELDEFDMRNAEDFAERTRWNRIAKEAKAAAADIEVPEDLPPERMNVAVLADEMDKASQHNAKIEARRRNRVQAAKQVDELRARAAKIETEAPGEIAKLNRWREERIADLQRQIAEVNARAESEIAALKSKAEPLLADAAAIRAKLDGAEPLPELKDVLAFKEQIANAQSINSGIDLRERRQERREEAERAEKKSRELTQAMDHRTELKRKMIEDAKMPVKGLGIQDGMVTYKGIPFEQCSSAEQLRVSVAIAMAANPKLKVLLIKDGSLLDSNSMAILSDMAERNQFQIWIEQVNETGDIGFVLEDGEIVADNDAAPPAPPPNRTPDKKPSRQPGAQTILPSGNRYTGD